MPTFGDVDTLIGATTKRSDYRQQAGKNLPRGKADCPAIFRSDSQRMNEAGTGFRAAPNPAAKEMIP